MNTGAMNGMALLRNSNIGFLRAFGWGYHIFIDEINNVVVGG
jgi:hypothetical protein